MAATQNTLQEDTRILTWKTFSTRTQASQSRFHYDKKYGYKRLKSQHKLCSMTSQIPIQQRWKQRTRNLKNSQTAVTVHGVYVTVSVAFEQSERSNWRTTRYEPSDKISARSNGGRNRSSNLKIPVLKRNAEKCCCSVR